MLTASATTGFIAPDIGISPSLCLPSVANAEDDHFVRVAIDAISRDVAARAEGDDQLPRAVIARRASLRKRAE